MLRRARRAGTEIQQVIGRTEAGVTSARARSDAESIGKTISVGIDVRCGPDEMVDLQGVVAHEARIVHSPRRRQTPRRTVRKKPRLRDSFRIRPAVRAGANCEIACQRTKPRDPVTRVRTIRSRARVRASNPTTHAPAPESLAVRLTEAPRGASAVLLLARLLPS